MASKNGEQQLTITLRGHEVPIERRMIRHTDLRFDPKNPRVYSLVRANEEEPEQCELEAALSKMDHVKRLVQAIRANGGLTDPILVRASDYVVIEGNSRLAAYRLLAKTDVAKWGKVKCDVVPADISEEHVFALLVQYHIVGRKDWDPFEQAGLFWRRYNEEGIDPSQIAEEMQDMGLSARRVQQMIKVYSFMVEHDDTEPSRWSYYEELLKSRALTRASEEHPELHDVVVSKIKSGEIPRAVDVRQKLDKVARSGGKPLLDFVSRKGDLDDCYERAVARGATNVFFNKLKKFREVVADPEIRRDIENMPKNQVDQCVFEMKKIRNAIDRLLKQAEK